jgi:hypothetical protein
MDKTTGWKPTPIIASAGSSDIPRPSADRSQAIRTNEILTELQDTVLGQNSAEVSERIDQRITTDDRTRANDRVTTDLCPVAYNRSKFTQPGRNQLGFGFHSDLLAIQSDVGEDDTGAEMNLITQHGVTDVTEVRDVGVIEDDAIFEFARITEHDPVADDDVFADVATAPDFAIVSDPGRTLDGRAVLNHRSITDVDIFADKGSAHDPGIDGWFQAELEVAADLLQDIPDLYAVIENSPVLCLIEIEKIRRREHME